MVNSRFAVMCAHYLFDTDFCNVASGWEKGIVEKNVQDSRRCVRLEATGQRWGSFEQLNAWLAQRCRELWAEIRHPEHRAVSIAEVLARAHRQDLRDRAGDPATQSVGREQASAPHDALQAGGRGVLRVGAAKTRRCCRPTASCRCWATRMRASTRCRCSLGEPDLPVDTNHLERSLRPIPLGRKKWMFNWTELGARQIGTVQSLIVTCQLYGINAYDYLVDVLQRIDHHPAARVDRLTRRLSKEHFAQQRLRPQIEQFVA